MNNNDLMWLRGLVGQQLEKKGELKQKDSALSLVTDRIMDVGRKIRMLIKYSGVYPEDEPIIDTGVYFSANLSKHNYFHLDKPIIFDHVISNDGDAYDPETGEFTAPLKGRYCFTVTIRAQFSKEVCAEITRNGEMLGRVSAEYGRLDKASGSMTVVAELDRGDIVKVTHYAVKSGDYFGNGFTAFSGFLFD